MDSSEDKAQSDLPLKKLRTEIRMCIICSTKALVTQLPQPKNLESWEALLTAARLQQFEPILKYEAEPELSASISYHRECHSTFTHKNMLQKLFNLGAQPVMYLVLKLENHPDLLMTLVGREFMNQFAYFVTK